MALSGESLDRRMLLAGAAALVAAPAWAKGSGFEAALAAIEKRAGGRLGVAVADRRGRLLAGRRTGERFPMCSTFKALAAGAVLARVDAGRERLDRVVRYARADLVDYSPETSKHAGAGMTLAALCEAAITLSDNTAGNLLLDAIGGPAGLTAFARELGDPATRLDRRETALNSAIPGDPRDTTTPAAMAADLARLGFGDALSPRSRARLIGWMRANTTGDKRLRAGLPTGWRAADKTGSGDRGTANDVAILWRPGGEPIIVTCYLTGATADAPGRDMALADVGRAIAAAFAKA